MSEKSKAAWAAILNKKRAQATQKDTVDVAAPVAAPVTKRGSTCGNPMCCMAQSRANITNESPSVVSPDGFETGGFAFRGIEPPMLCSGTAWQPRELTKWEKRRQEAKAAPGLNEFKKR